MKRIALAAMMALLCMCMAGCASNSAGSGQSGEAGSSASQDAGSSSSSSSAASSDTLSVGEEVDVAGSIILVTSDSFVVDCTGLHFTCVPADADTLRYVTAGNVVEVEGTVASIEGDSSITLENVTIDDYSDGYRNIGEHYQHHGESHHGR